MKLQQTWIRATYFAIFLDCLQFFTLSKLYYFIIIFLLIGSKNEEQQLMERLYLAVAIVEPQGTSTSCK